MSYSVYRDDLELDLGLDFEPWMGDVKVQKVGDKIVAGYLAHDDSPGNPMEDFDGQGTLVTDDSACGHFGLKSFGGRHYDPEYDLEAGGIIEGVAELLKEKIRQTPELIPWAVRLRLELGAATYIRLAEKLAGEWQGDIDWSDEDEEFISKLGDFESYAEKAWEMLYDQGKMGTCLAIPVRYDDHGSSGMSIYPCSLDSANAAWIPDKCCLDNMASKLAANATYAEKLKVAEKYAKSVLDEYQKWCNGEVYGVVIETFDEDGEHIDTESCWGFIGDEYAEEEMESNFKSTCEYLEKAYAEEVRTQCGSQVELPLAA